LLNFFDEQKYVYANCDARINILDGPVRSGKTVSSICAWTKYIATAPPGDLVMTGKTIAALYRNIIRPMEDMLGSDIKYTNTKDNRVIQLWGREIFCFGANDERSEGKIRGSTFAGAYGDEITLWPETYFKMLMSRLSVAGSKFIGTTNPDNPQHWLKVDYIDKIKTFNIKDRINGRVFNWPIERNTHLPKEYIIDIKKEYTGLWYKRFILGEWCVAEGAIYDFFDEELHVGKNMPDARYHIVSVDYGTGNPTSFGLYGVNPNTTPKIWRKRGYWWDSRKESRQKTDAEYVEDMEEFLGKDTPDEIKPYKVIVDPSAASFKLALMRAGYFVVDADNSVIDGIRTQACMLQTGQYMIEDHPSNAPCIKEYYGYIWDENVAKKGEDKPKKEGDHCLVGETLVDTAEGQVMIKNLIGKEGFVHCYDTTTKKPTIKRFYNARKTREKMSVFKLKLKSGKVLYCTSDHKILSLDKWKLAEHLNQGEKVVSITNHLQRYKIQPRCKNKLLSIIKKNWGKARKATSFCLSILVRKNTRWLRNSSQRFEQIKQPFIKLNSLIPTRTFGNSFGKYYARKTATNKADAEKSNIESKRMASIRRWEKMAFKAGEADPRKYKENKERLCRLWERIRNNYNSQKSLQVLSSKLQSEGFTDEVESFTDTGIITDTYCMTVDDVHNFSVNGGLIVANSMDEQRYVLHTEFGVDTLDLRLLTTM